MGENVVFMLVDRHTIAYAWAENTDINISIDFDQKS